VVEGAPDRQIRYVLHPPRHPALGYEDFEVSVLAPCTHDKPCPLRKVQSPRPLFLQLNVMC
jgi:ribosomal protein RSM22 (predicted rRNA methylase)